jgi:hypothetical protein
MLGEACCGELGFDSTLLSTSGGVWGWWRVKILLLLDVVGIIR